MTMKQCKDYGLKCLQCPYWNHWTNFCTKWKITISTSGDGMTENKRFKLDDFDSDVEMWELLNIQAEVISDLEKENEQLKQSNKELLLLVDALKEQNIKFKTRLNDLGVEYYD